VVPNCPTPDVYNKALNCFPHQRTAEAASCSVSSVPSRICRPTPQNSNGAIGMPGSIEWIEGCGAGGRSDKTDDNQHNSDGTHNPPAVQ
jgi:hypothetical protein